MSTRIHPISRIAASAQFVLLFAGAGMAQPGAIDPAFNVGTGANGRVASAAMQLDGLVVIGGSFTSYNGTARNRLARLRRDGTLDPAYTIGTGFNGQVNCVAIAPDGKALVCGQFTGFNGTTRNRIARLNTNGTLDATFVPPGTGFSAQVTAVVVQPDGKVIAVGDFLNYNGTARSRVARLNTDGTLDVTFNPGTGANSLVTCAALQSDGKVIIGGFFNNYNGSFPIGIARISSTGAFDGTFTPGGVGLNNSVDCITLQSDGKVLVGGLFSTYNGISRNRILRLNTNGSLDATFTPGTGATGTGARVSAIQVQKDGNILLGGVFTSYNGTARTRLARVSSTGALDASWTAGANDAINALLFIPEGRLIAGGIFTAISGVGRNRIARLKAMCTDSVEMVVTTDGNGAQTSWEIIPQGYTYAACSGSGFPNNTTTSSSCCLGTGCYRLRVMDSGGDGILNGGYVLNSESGARMIDNTANFTAGSVSAIVNNEGFCIPIGSDGVIHSSCGKLDWVVGQFVVARSNAAVSAQWMVGDQTDDGYEFWFFDPNGGYSFKRFRSHAVSDGFAPANATRACHMKINNWTAANHLQQNVLYNVRVRSRVNGVNGAFGETCRFMIDPLRAQCQLAKLEDNPASLNLSCGQERAFGPANYVYAHPVTGANKYQFRFRIPSEGFSVTRTSNNYILLLNWVTNPLVAGKTYQVDVRVSKNGGATWCSDFIPPSLDPWGDVCLLTITNSMNGGDDRMLEDGVSLSGEGLVLWPNPCAGDGIDLRLDGLSEALPIIDLVVTDAMGRAVYEQQEAISAPSWSTHLGFTRRLAPGTYVVQVMQGTRRWMQRFAVTD